MALFYILIKVATFKKNELFYLMLVVEFEIIEYTHTCKIHCVACLFIETIPKGIKK